MAKRKIGFRRLYVGFGLIILIALGNLIFNYTTTSESINSTEDVNNKIVPYVNKLSKLKVLLDNSKAYTTGWVFLPKNELDKERLTNLHEKEYPKLKNDINAFLKLNPEFDQDSLSEILLSFDDLILLQEDIMAMLADFSAYEEGAIEPALAQELLEFEVIPLTEETLVQLNEVVQKRQAEADLKGAQIHKSLVRILRISPLLSVIIFAIIVFAIIYIDRVITTPVIKVKNALTTMSSGKQLSVKIREGEGVIKEMIGALKILSDSFAKTTQFAVDIGGGNFEAGYDILSEDDDLGKSLIQMKESLNSYSKEMEEKVKQRTEELQETLNDLKSTQSQLIQSEKMASLGQLIAGVAHEINTPLGAIRASIGAVSDSLPKTLEMFPKVYKELPEDHIILFESMLTRAYAADTNVPITSREERKYRRALKEYFQEKGFAEANDLATLFVDIGIYSDLDVYLPMLSHEKAQDVLKTVYYLVLQKKASDNINLAVSKASKVVFALKTYARQDQSGERSKVAIDKNIDTVLTLYHNTLKQGVEINRYYEDIPDTFCYPDELSQVWTNLITNAIHAMDSKGVMDIYLKNDKGVIDARFTDHGSGIPDEVLAKIFDPFYTTKKAGEGSGLGLDIVKKIIEKHQGTIDVETKVGEGTTFIVRFPIVEEEENN